MTKKLIIATVATTLYLILVNALVFPLIFPDGLAEKFSNERQTQLFQYHLIALVITSFMLSYLYSLFIKSETPWKDGLKFGALLGIFVSLPEHIHLYAMVDSSFIKQFIPVLWILITWGIAGVLVSLIYGKIKADESK